MHLLPHQVSIKIYWLHFWEGGGSLVVRLSHTVYDFNQQTAFIKLTDRTATANIPVTIKKDVTATTANKPVTTATDGTKTTINIPVTTAIDRPATTTAIEPTT